MSGKRVEFYGLASCDTCRKAQKALAAAGYAVEVRDVRTDGVAPDALKTWLATHGAELLVNLRSTTWRGLDDAERAKAETQAGALELLLAHPTLMKRPVMVIDGGSHVGWSKQVQGALL